ncbi:MAG TPA: ABC transporter permease [Bryobacteraceae bacterium]|nr:ABC transporter permease [Bryobacteraceae bacterium]
MQIPLAYNIRNLVARRVTTLMTALGAALAVAVLVSVLALAQGLRTSFEATGDPRDLIVMRKGSTAELISVITRTNFQDIRTRPGIARNARGQPLLSLEMVTVVNLEDPADGSDMNLNLRGLLPIGLEMRSQVRIASGRMFQPGRREVVVGKAIADRFASARIGGKLGFARGDWTVVGILDGGRSAYNSEIWADLNQVSSDYNRAEFLSSVLIRTEPENTEALSHTLAEDPRMNVFAQSERDYYASQTGAARPVRFMGMFVAVIMAIGSAFAAMNTMYASVARRSAEIGTLRVVGFSRIAILSSFLIESVILALVGGVLGCVLTLPLNNVKTEIGSFRTFSSLTFNFHVTVQVMAIGIMFAVIIGAAGGLLPASNAARRQIIAALRG